MRLQLAIPDNTFLSPVTFNRMLSNYGATAVFFFAIPLALGLFYYVAPLQIGARGTALPRLGQLGLALYIAGATVLYAGFLFTPSEAGRQPAGAADRGRLPRQQRGRRLGDDDRPGDPGLRLHRDRPADDAAQHAGAGHGLAPGAGLRLGRRGQLLADALHRSRLAGGADDADDRPQLRRHLLRRRLRRRTAALAAPELDLLLRHLHVDPDLRLRRDRRNRRRLLRQTALQPRRRDGFAGGDRGDRHPGLDAEHADRADRAAAGCTSRC